VLVELGELAGVLYDSDKWDGRRKSFIHETTRPRPRLFATPDRKRLVILGGQIRVKPDGLVG
jgi:hypothetical protein